MSWCVVEVSSETQMKCVAGRYDASIVSVHGRDIKFYRNSWPHGMISSIPWKDKETYTQALNKENIDEMLEIPLHI